jgi:D-hydroxyproline dehydrogenase subunit gamma
VNRDVSIIVNGKSVTLPAGSTVAAALDIAGVTALRKSVGGEPRGPLCGMGICFECRVNIDGQSHERACQTFCREGMEVRTDA